MFLQLTKCSDVYVIVNHAENRRENPQLTRTKMWPLIRRWFGLRCALMWCPGWVNPSDTPNDLGHHVCFVCRDCGKVTR